MLVSIGTIKNIYIDLDQIIGGEKNIGEGWKMLMECLSSGRGICLPATAKCQGKVATFGIYNYIKVHPNYQWRSFHQIWRQYRKNLI